MVHVRKYEFQQEGNQYDIHSVPETTLITILEGVRWKLTQYKRDIVDPKFLGPEDQMFLRSMITELEEFIGAAGRYMRITANGFEVRG